MSVTDELIDRVLDGEASEQEVAEVLCWLDAPGNLGRFARRAELHADLRRSLRRRKIQAAALRVCDEQSAASPEVAARASRSRRPERRGLVVVIAALVSAACLLLVLNRPDRDRVPDASRPDAASVVSGVDALLTKDDREWNGAGLPVGEYRLQHGLLNLQFDGGVMVYLEAPARFEAVSGQRFVLHAGRLSATVPPEGVGFTVVTPEADVIDFVTEFSVEARAGASEVHVYQGLVRVQPKARMGLPAGDPVDLKTSQAITIDDTVRKPVEIELATDGFIRSFDEPQKKYCRAVKELKPVAYYRMPISKGFPCEPPEYSGELLGEGNRVPRAPGFLGGALQVGGRSAGRGALVTQPPVLDGGRLSIMAHVYLENLTAGSTVATNLDQDKGNFALSVDERGRPRATFRARDGELVMCIGDVPLPRRQWCHLLMTADGDDLRLFLDGKQVGVQKCPAIANGNSGPIWFGTDSSDRALWDGRIDELAFFNRPLSSDEVQGLHAAVLDTVRTKRQPN
jgi:hypothetical protein